MTSSTRLPGCRPAAPCTLVLARCTLVRTPNAARCTGPVLDELVAYFGDGNRSAYLRATLKVMKSIMIADQLREAQAYGQQRTAELGIEPSDIPARVQEFLKADS